jgi:nitrogen fixation NifU-like protein
MTLDQAFNVSPKDVARELGGLPDNKIHCSVLGDKALRAAINNYYVRHGMEDRVKKEQVKIVCQCMNVTDHDIEEAVLEGARTYYELQERTKLGTVCGQCKDEAESLIEKFKHIHFGV